MQTRDDEADDPDERAMDDRQIRDETITLFAAGHETTALSLTWTLYLLATHPEWAIPLACRSGRSSGRPARHLSDLPRLTVTEQLLTESMRLYPPLWTTGRMAFESFELGGYTIPAGAVLAAPQSSCTAIRVV